MRVPRNRADTTPEFRPFPPRERVVGEQCNALSDVLQMTVGRNLTETLATVAANVVEIAGGLCAKPQLSHAI